MRSPPPTSTPVIPSWPTRRFVTGLSNRTSPPSAVMVSRIRVTIAGRRSLPRCGFAWKRISSGAPASTNSSSTFRHARVVDRRAQLAVGEGARASLAEVQVRLGGQLPGGPEPVDVAVALGDRSAALQQQRAVTHARKHEGGEQPRRAAAHDHRPMSQPLRAGRHRAVLEVGGFDAGRRGVPRPERRLVLHGDVDHVDDADRPHLAGVDRLAPDEVLLDVPGARAEPIEDGPLERGLVVIQRQRNLVQAQHRSGPRRVAAGHPARRPGPLEVEAAAVTVHVQHLAAQVESRLAPRLEGRRIHLVHVHAAGRHLCVVPRLAARDVEGPRFQQAGERADRRSPG